jgi:hypothetical protein
MAGPAGAHRLPGLPVNELSGQLIDLADLFGGAARRLAEQLRETPNRRLRFALMDQFLLRRMAGGPRPSPQVGWVWHRLVTTGGTVPPVHWNHPDRLSGGRGRPSPRTGNWRVSLASSAASALGMSRREMLGERQVTAPLMAQRAAHGAVRLAHRRFQPGPCVSIELAGLRRSGKPQRPSQCQFGHEPLVLAFALFAPAASRPGQHRAMRRQCGRQVAPCGHASTVRQRTSGTETRTCGPRSSGRVAGGDELSPSPADAADAGAGPLQRSGGDRPGGAALQPG